MVRGGESIPKIHLDILTYHHQVFGCFIFWLHFFVAVVCSTSRLWTGRDSHRCPRASLHNLRKMLGPKTSWPQVQVAKGNQLQKPIGCLTRAFWVAKIRPFTRGIDGNWKPWQQKALRTTNMTFQSVLVHFGVAKNKNRAPFWLQILKQKNSAGFLPRPGYDMDFPIAPVSKQHPFETLKML